MTKIKNIQKKKKVLLKKLKLRLSFPLMYGLLGLDNIWPRYNYLKIWNLRVQTNLNIEKITFKIVQLKFLAMHITNQKWSFDIFTVGNLQNIFMEHDLYLIS